MTSASAEVKPKAKRGKKVKILALVALIALISPLTLGAFGQIYIYIKPKVVELDAYQFGWSPSTIKVSVGEPVIFKVQSKDVTHGVWIDGQNMKTVPISPEEVLQKLEYPFIGDDYQVLLKPGKEVEVGPISFTTPGKYKIRCAVSCGPLHPFMMADIVVEPNYPFYTLSFMTVAAGGGTILYLSRKKPEDEVLGIPNDKEIDLLKIRFIGPLLKKFLQWRGAHFLLIWPNLLIFMIVLATGFFGNPLGALNFSIVVVWILWFAAVEFMILFAGRLWCTLCPLPAFGEWITRKRIYGVLEPRMWLTLGKIWPKRLTNMWIPALGFLGISLIVPWLVTRPVVTGFLFLLLFALGLFIPLIYIGGRNFCRHICPASGYIGHHASASIFSVSSRDKGVCDKCAVKTCIKGSPEGYGCPWKLYPGGKDINTNCGQCFECLKACVLDNMTLKIKMIGRDLSRKVRAHADEAWMGFIRFTLAPIYYLAFFGPFFFIKNWGNMGRPFGANLWSIGLLSPSSEGIVNWLLWVAMVSSIALVIFPAVFFLFSWLAKRVVNDREHSSKHIFLAFSNALTPYALLMWIAFGITLLSWDWWYPLMAFSNPLGTGWNLLGISGVAWSPPLAAHLTSYITAPIVYLGLAIGIHCTYNTGRLLFGDHSRALKATAVMSILYGISALIYIWIMMGALE